MRDYVYSIFEVFIQRLILYYLIGTSEFFDRFGLKKGSNESHCHRWTYKICLHAKMY